jgi:hypothetical protein
MASVRAKVCARLPFSSSGSTDPPSPSPPIPSPPLPSPPQFLDTAAEYATLPNWLILVACMRLLAVILGYTYPASVLGGQNLETQLFNTANSPSPASSASPASDKPRSSPRLTAQASSRREFTPLAGRTFSVWTAVTCLVCLSTAQEPTSPSLLRLCLGTFLIALVYFILELSVYKTVSFKTASRPAVIACASPLSPPSLIGLRVSLRATIHSHSTFLLLPSSPSTHSLYPAQPSLPSGRATS